MSFALLASLSATVHPSAPPNDWTFSAAPTVKTFLADAGEATVWIAGPALPAENTITISWFPATGKEELVGWASRVSASKAWAVMS